MSQDWTPPPANEKIPNYLVPAIISAVCCFPLGIISIVFAAQVNSKVTAGDIPGAMEASKRAKLCSFILGGIGIVGWLCYILFTFGIVGLSMMNS